MFANRSDAGRRLAARLAAVPRDNLVVLGLPRGGVPVAFEVAELLGAPLDVILVRKLGVPFQPELAMGAIGEDGVRIINRAVLRDAAVSVSDFAEVEARERVELARRAKQFREDRKRQPLTGRTALIVDDGIATGSTARAACEVAREHGADRVILAAPIASPRTIEGLRAVADDVIVLASPTDFSGIGQFYDDFRQTTDHEVISLLARARARATGPVAVEVGAGFDGEVTIDTPGVQLAGQLTIPRGATAMVLFAHGSGSSRHSTRNQFVAGVLNRARVGTLLFDLLTSAEERDRSNVFDIELLAERLVAATRWLGGRIEARGARIGFFGASTGAAAALWAGNRSFRGRVGRRVAGRPP